MISNIKNWFHNYWYYYKWRVIIVSFFVVIAVFCTVQFFTQNKTTDVTVAFIGPYFPAADSEKEIGNAFSQIMSKDLNGDGKKNATVIITSAFTDGWEGVVLPQQLQGVELSVFLDKLQHALD